MKKWSSSGGKWQSGEWNNHNDEWSNRNDSGAGSSWDAPEPQQKKPCRRPPKSVRDAQKAAAAAEASGTKGDDVSSAESLGLPPPPLPKDPPPAWILSGGSSPPPAALGRDDLAEQWESLTEAERLRLIGVEDEQVSTSVSTDPVTARPKARPIKYVRNLVGVTLREVNRQVDTLERGLLMDLPVETMKEQINWWSNIQEEVKSMLETGNAASAKWVQRIKALEDQGLKKDDGKERITEPLGPKTEEKDGNRVKDEKTPKEPNSEDDDDDDAEIPTGDAEVKDESDDIIGMDVPPNVEADEPRVHVCGSCGKPLEISPGKTETDQCGSADADTKEE